MFWISPDFRLSLDPDSRICDVIGFQISGSSDCGHPASDFRILKFQAINKEML